MTGSHTSLPAILSTLALAVAGLPGQSVPDTALLDGLHFREIGPAMCSGRIADLAVDPANPARWFVAVASGGVWRTLDNGTTFEPVFDGEGSYSVGCVTLDPGNPQVVWVGTGENNAQRSVSWGDGVYRSRDGGRSFERVGLFNSQHIGRIVVDPRDSDRVFVAAQGPLWNSGGDRGLYRTTDGGTTWSRVLHVSDDTGINEVHLDPRDPDVLYASAWQRRRHVWTLIDGGPESTVFKSTDGGDTWREIASGLPGVDKGRIGLAVSPADPDVVYAIVEAQRGKGGLFRSVDRGESWQQRSGKVAGSPQYYNELVCDPHDVDTVYCLDTFTSVSRDGGASFATLGNLHRHVDDHALWIDPRQSGHLLIGGDGGLYESWDGGTHWDFKENLPVGQFYRVSVDQAEPFYNVYGGTQDNNSMGGPSRTTSLAGITNEDWFVTVGGDGYEAQVDPTDPNIVYTQWQYGGLVRHDRRSGEITDIKPREPQGGPPLKWNWDSPLLLSEHSHTRLYFAANVLFRSDDRGDSWQALSGDLSRGIDRDLLKVMGRQQEVDAVAKDASTSFYGNSTALAESPLDERVLYVGTDDGLVWATRDGGSSWNRIDGFPGVPERTYVTRLEASRHVAGRVWVAFSNHKNGDFSPYLLVSDDYGASWRSIASGLPSGEVVWSLGEDHVAQGLLFLGTESGLWVTFDEGGHWTRMKSGLPTIAVRDLAIQRREDDLVLGTYGRGFWVLDDYSSLRALAESGGEATLFPIRAVPLYVEQSRLGLNTGLGSQGSTFFHADNPPFGALITFRLRDGFQTLKEQREAAQAEARRTGAVYPFPGDDALRSEDHEVEPRVFVTVRDAAGEVVRRIDAPRAAGLHRVAWDLRYPRATEVELGESGPGAPWSMPDAGPLVLGGTFSATLEAVVAGEVRVLGSSQSFDVEPLNLASLPAADRAEVLAFQADVVALRRAVRMAQAALAELEDRVAHCRAAIVDTPRAELAWLTRVDALAAELLALQTALDGDATVGRRNDPVAPGIAERVENVAGAQLYTSSAPTATEREAWRIAADEYAPVQERLRTLALETLPALERDLEAAGAPATPHRLPDWRR